MFIVATDIVASLLERRADRSWEYVCLLVSILVSLLHLINFPAKPMERCQFLL